MKELKDYLPFYLGCDCLYNEETHFLGGQKFVLTMGTLFYAMSQADEFKPILRPLSDMTQEEHDDWDDFGPIRGTTELIQYEAGRTHYLLSKHFDLFGLIEAGLAVDKAAKEEEAINAALNNYPVTGIGFNEDDVKGPD